MNKDYGTLKPGRKVETTIAKKIIAEFRNKYRDKSKGIPWNLPTSCTLKGQVNEGILDSKMFLKNNKIFIYFDNGSELYEISPKTVSEFFKNREPWEDFDFCLFDMAMNWCVGITHNNDIIVVDPNNLLSDAG